MKFVATALLICNLLVMSGVPGASYAPVASVTVQSSTCTITGYVYKPDNVTPVVGARIRVVKATKDGSNVLFSVIPTSTPTDETGKFTITAPRGPNSTIWVSAPIQGFNVAAGMPVVVPDAATAELRSMQAVTNPPAFLTVLVPTKTTIKQAGSAFATDVSVLNFTGFDTLTESPTGQVNIAPLSTATGTFTTSLTVGYIVSGPSNDGLYRSSTGNLSFPNSNLGIKNNDPQVELDVTGTVRATKINVTTFTPSGTADATGATGEIRWDASFIYVKTAAGWKRAALSTF